MTFPFVSLRAPSRLFLPGLISTARPCPAASPIRLAVAPEALITADARPLLKMLRIVCPTVFG